ncbi:ATP-binding protein [Peribacillus sp. SI8-4]|uniref:ATP-dependent nuclease n=1 Tax=Peribacillus sp. SI8-4 TaxID=3048009 RepID=UPI0025527CA2|nr:ATP-binding protein [Peribacillus sp. SI8-4]
MKIKELKVNGWRSFSDKGITLSNLKRINLIIGPNNSGKSNLIRFFSSLKTLFSNHGAPNLILTCFLEEEDTWIKKCEDVTCELTVETQDRTYICEVIRTKVQKKEIFKINGVTNDDSFYFWKNIMTKKIKIFTDIRGFFINSQGKPEHRVDGIRTADFVFTKGIHDYKWYEQYQLDMSRWLSALLNADVTLETKLINPNYGQSPYVRDNRKAIPMMEDQPLEKAEYQLFFNKEGNNLIHEPIDLGVGVLQFILLLTAIYQCKDEECIIFIEEPEMNLHAKSISDLIRILETDSVFKKHQYFLITHSNVILNLINENYSVHRFEQDNMGATSVTSCLNKVDNFAILDLLGIQPSQLLLSNLVIWVEGPSDRIYINKWIELYNTIHSKNYSEGKNYSFVFYGGSLLDHYTILKENESNLSDFIDFLNTSRYSIVVCDSDIGGTRTEYKGRLQRLKDRLDETNAASPYVYLWITDGREIENYIPKDKLTQVICNEIKHRSRFTYVNENKETIVHQFDEPNPKIISEMDFIESFSFDEFFAQMYVHESELENQHLKNSIIKNVGSSFNKIEIAKKVALIWDIKDLNDENLNNHMKNVIQFLDKANL